MIEINLLPQELKKILKKQVTSDRKIKRIFYIAVLVFGILIFIHIILLNIAIMKKIQFATLNNKWQQRKLDWQAVENFKKGIQGTGEDAQIIPQLMNKRMLWAKKINQLSLNLPSGVWFNEITITPKGFILKASVVSLQKEDMNLVNQFIDNIKKDTEFFKDFQNLELNYVQGRTVGGYDVTDFTIQGALKAK